MKKASFLLVIFFGLMLSCTKETKETQVEIHYEMLHNVSPVKVKFSVNLEPHWSEWLVNSQFYPISDYKNKVEFVFNEPGISSIKFLATSIFGEKFFGDLEIEIPLIANRLVINGFYFKDQYDFNISNEDLIFNFSYFNGNSHTDYSTLVSKSNFESDDKVHFETPIVIEISGFDTVEGENQFVFLSINGEDTNQSYFRSNFFVQEWYYGHRVDSSPDYIYLDKIGQGSSQRLYLLSDWNRY